MRRNPLIIETDLRSYTQRIIVRFIGRNDFTQDTFLVVGNIASVFTLISFVLAYIWNKQSERKAKKDERERFRLLAQALGSIRDMEKQKAKMEKERLLRKADNLKFKKDAVIKSLGTDTAEIAHIENEYALQINEITASISDLNSYMSSLDFAAIDDLNKVIEKL